MACFHPLKGYRSKELTRNGKRKLTFNPKEAFIDLQIEVPCGQCIGCRLDRSRQWAVRCMHEASLYERNCFITLTYEDKYIPENSSLRFTDFQLFFKRLRKKFGEGIRYYHCGEYGERFSRPHYHCIIFNFDFPDKRLFSTNSRGDRYYRSTALEELWPYGISMVGNVTFESAAYVARYCLKKVNGKMREDHYQGRDSEYVTMSRRPGIGKMWYEKYKKNTYSTDSIVLNGKELKVPKYYDSLYEIEYPSDYRRIQYLREKEREKNPEKYSMRRLAVKEKIQQLRAKKLARPYEIKDERKL